MVTYFLCMLLDFFLCHLLFLIMENTNVNCLNSENLFRSLLRKPATGRILPEIYIYLKQQIE